MSDTEILIPVEKAITIMGREYTVKKLGLTQNIKILRLIGSLQESTRAQIIADVESGKSDMAALLENIACENLPGLVGMLLDSKDDFTGINLEDFSDLTATLTEVNNFEKIFANFQRTAKNLSGVTEAIKRLLSLPSSQK